jgi:two-component system LytT family response regulator
MIRTLIVDDEPLARKRLRTLLAAFSDVQVRAEAGNGADAVTMIETEPADLLLLDVQMPDLDGFGVLRMVETEKMPLVIFVTAYDEYAVNAFEVSAVDYLLKPVRRERLAQALSKAREQLAARSQVSAQLNRFLHTSAPQPASYLQRLPVRAQNRILILPIEQITSLRIDRGLVCVTTAEGEFWTKYTTFTELEGLLDPHLFQRIHRQIIVNLNHVREITTFDNNTARLTLTGGEQVSVSRNHLKALRQILNW